MPAIDFKVGYNAVTATEITGFENGLYRFTASGNDVVVSQRSTNEQGFVDIGTVVVGTSSDAYLDSYSVIKCTFSGTCTIKRISGIS